MSLISSDPPPEIYGLLDETYTPLFYLDKLKMDFMLNAISYILNLCLFIFIRSKSQIWNSLRSTVVFVTTGSVILNIPQLFFQTWMVSHLVVGSEPTYTILFCSFLKNFGMSTNSAFQVLPFAVSIYRYQTVVMKKRPANSFVIIVHSIVSILFISLTFLAYPFGNNRSNDVCYVLRFSVPMEMIKNVATLSFNIIAIFMNCLILKFVMNFKKESAYLQQRQMELTQTLLIQSIIPVLVSLPMIMGSFEYYLALDLNIMNSISSTWYVATFLDPILMPLSSVLGIRKTRQELFSTLFCVKKERKSTTTVSVVATNKLDRSTFRDDD